MQPARVPSGIDAEDKVIFGLTPQRLAYVGLGLLAAAAAWRSLPHWLGGPCVALIALAAIGVTFLSRYGRRADQWLVDAGLWALRNRRVQIVPATDESGGRRGALSQRFGATRVAALVSRARPVTADLPVSPAPPGLRIETPHARALRTYPRGLRERLARPPERPRLYVLPDPDGERTA